MKYIGDILIDNIWNTNDHYIKLYSNSDYYSMIFLDVDTKNLSYRQVTIKIYG
jgi:hypothetical protein